jgi:predicted ATPase
MILGTAIKTSRGYAAPEVGEAYSRARELCRGIDDPARVIPVLIGLVAHYIVGGDIESSRDVSVEMQKLFERIGNPHLQMLGEWSFGAALFHLGELEEGYRHCARGLDLYDPSFHGPRVWETGIEPGIFCRCELSRFECLRGEPDKALTTVTQAVAEARALEHPQTLAFALIFAAFAHQERREWRLMGQAIEEAVSLCASRGIAQESMWAEPLAAVAQFEQGETSDGLARMEDGLATIEQMRSPLLRPFYLNSYADMLRRTGRLEAAQAALEESGEVARATSQHAYDAETLRLWGELHVTRGDPAAAHDCFVRAIADAESRGAQWLKFRAALARSQLLLDQDRLSEALEVLRPGLSAIAGNISCVEVLVATELVGLLENRAKPELV